MDKALIAGLIALVVGGGAGYALGAGKAPEANTGAHTMTMESMMASMNAELEGKTGDEFDKAFLTEMTAHHMGAVEMAELALQNANHAEIKNMAQAIISAQNAEVAQMKQWQTAWYGAQAAPTSTDNAQQGSAVHHAQ